MKAIHYDAEGDILSVTFAEANQEPHTGVELSDNIVLYYNPETERPLKLILLSYQAMLQASRTKPILLDGLTHAPAKVQKIVTKLLQHTPVTVFIQLSETSEKNGPTSRLQEIFTPSTLQSVAAA